ncbi:MAG: ATP-dependent RecD-like DNA helicase [Aestuariivita sp.]|nr:ATP-dependent RecD-like DNA helicase [Aestuariivita sp.]
MSNPIDHDTPTETLSGMVERVTYHNEENGFCVLRVKARGYQEMVTTVGWISTISAGEWISASGSWFNDYKHGRQFKAKFIKASTPTSLDGIRKYLASGMIYGIGTIYAKRMVDEFGMRIFDIIEQSPKRLREIEGIGPKRAKKIIKGWASQKIVREIMLFLHQHGVGSARAVRIYKTYGQEAIQIMSRNPYRLSRDIHGIGFRTADLIAGKIGIEKSSMIRVQAGISFTLFEALNDGHCGLPRHELYSRAEKLLEVPISLVESALNIELTNKTVISDHIENTECIFLNGLYRAEHILAENIQRIQADKTPWPYIDADKALPWVEEKTGLKLAASQTEAIRLALKSKITVITGGPGVGKTTIVNSILQILTAKSIKIKLCAPTGRAAKRMTEATGMSAKTIHRMLEFDPTTFGFKRNADHHIKCDLLVIDECSMVDVRLMKSLLEAIPSSAGLLIVGDIDQLPSVGPGQVLADIIHSNSVPVVRLTEVFRQAAESKIISTAHAINSGYLPKLNAPTELTDLYFIQTDEAENAVKRIIQLVTQRIPMRFKLDPIKDIQVLCPMNKGGVGAQAINFALQAALNPNPPNSITKFGWKFASGDKVMQVKNDYDKDVFNGDIGRIKNINNEEQEVSIDFDGQEVDFSFGELDTLVPSYAATIHKSQGSEYPAVIIPIMMSHYVMLQRNLFYTAVTRGKQLVVIIGQQKALRIAVKRANVRQRWSKLNEWLMDTDQCSNSIHQSPV